MYIWFGFGNNTFLYYGIFAHHYVGEKLCCELIEKSQIKKSKNDEWYINVIYNRRGEFKGFTIYMDKENFNDSIWIQ